MVNRDVLHHRLSKLEEYLRILDSYRESLDRRDLDENATIRGAVERYFQLAAEAMIDIGNHVAAAEGLVPPEDFKGTFTRLEEAGVLHADLAARLRGWVGFRNILVQDNMNIDCEVVWRTLQEDLGDIREFVVGFSRFTEAPERGSPNG